MPFIVPIQKLCKVINLIKTEILPLFIKVDVIKKYSIYINIKNSIFKDVKKKKVTLLASISVITKWQLHFSLAKKS